MKLRKIYKVSVLPLLAATYFAFAGVQPPVIEPRIAGLEGNEEYMTLLQQDARLQMQEDSITQAVDKVRRLLRDDPENRQQYSQQILQSENAIFELRNAKGRLIDRINTIEQDWVLANLNGAIGQPSGSTTPDQTEVEPIPDTEKVRNLIDNRYFREHLPTEEYADLQQAQHRETEAIDYVNRYFANHQTVTELAEAYAATQTEAEALDIFGRYKTLQGLNQVLADSLAEAWNFIFDNKSYAYGYLLDSLNQESILSQEEAQLSEAARQLSEIEDQVASKAVADYFLRKRVAVDYEIAVAELLKLNAARDSLHSVAAQIAAIDYKLPRVEIAERSFIQYDTLQYSAVSPYTYQNPIPECRVYSLGTIYRILVGTFNTKRAASTFRGAHPLCYKINDEGKWCYYAGAFATREEAEVAQKSLKAHGFLRPEIVVWNDGVERNLSRDAEVASIAYRVEIAGVESLPEPVKELITQFSEGRELSRVGQQLFVIGLFDDKAVADQLASAIAGADPSLEIKVAEIAE